jgi:hypothetical protein
MKINMVWILCIMPILLYAKTDSAAYAYKFVYNLYSNYQNGNNNFRFDGPRADTIFSSELLKLIRLDEKLANGEVGYLGSDPICNCQDPEGFKLLKIAIDKKTDATYAEVKYKISATGMSLLLKLEEKNGKWLISDIVSPKKHSLFEFLSKSLSDSNQNSIYKK